MAVCAACGQENPPGFAFCGRCGKPLEAAPAQREVRKVVTVVFCDLTGSTALGDSADPEALRRRMQAYYEQTRAIVERHGGTVEKFVGDAVMAVFGIPVAHEDDALRAVRAAWQMRETVVELGLAAHIGVNTGPVVAGEGDTLVTGDAVNVAARLEQAAAAGEVLLGAGTRGLVRDAVRVEPVSVDAKGKPDPVAAFRLTGLDLDSPAVARHLDVPLVGRERERARLRADFDRVVSARTCQLFTLLGAPGIGKSRLALDFLADADARVVRGRCLHYGEGITYWPLVEVVLGLGASPEDVLAASPVETQVRFRQLLEQAAQERPLVVVLDDLQWAEPTFLDLVEHVVDWTRDAPIFLLCIARPELLDQRPNWGGGKLNATSILLEPLPVADVQLLLDNLAGPAVAPEVRGRILAAADGNPLFVEEMAAMAREAEGEVAVPPTIQALLQARLDQLGADERTLLERGAVEGEVFHRAAMLDLSPEPVRAGAPERLLSLIRKDLIRPAPSLHAYDDAFRFRHLLIRDAAYDSLPKATRADLHERFALWLDEHAELVEQDEIVGYHLEQAAQYRDELGGRDERLAELASARLAAAATGALGRGDYRAGVALLRRAAGLFRGGDQRRLRLLPELAYALVDRFEPAAAAEVAAEALRSEDPVTRAQAEIGKVDAELMAGELLMEEGRERLERSRAVLREAGGGVLGLARAAVIEGSYHWSMCEAEAARAAFEEGLAYAESIGYLAAIDGFRSSLTPCYVFGPTPVAEAVERLATLREEAESRQLLLARSAALRGMGRMLVLDGRFDEAQALFDEAFAGLLESGIRAHYWNAWGQAHAFLARAAGDSEREERVLREAHAQLEELGERIGHSTIAANLARSLLIQGRLEEAAKSAATARRLTLAEDASNLILADGVDALVAVERGDGETALRLARRIDELTRPTDFFQMHGWTGQVLERVGQAVGDESLAAEGRRAALDAYERKGARTIAKLVAAGELF